MNAFEVGPDFLDRFLRCRGSDFGLGPGAETLGNADPHLDDTARARRREGLSVGIGDDELHPLKTALDHIVNGIAARTANAYDGDTRPQLGQTW